MAIVQTDQEPDNPGFPGLVTGEPAIPETDEVDRFGRVLEEVEVALAGVERALRRLDDGTYGTCEVCGRPSETRAGDLPTAGLRCSEHRSARADEGITPLGPGHPPHLPWPSDSHGPAR